MPTWDKILNQKEQGEIQHIFEKYVTALYNKTKRTTICYLSAFTIIKPKVPLLFQAIIDQDIQGFMTCSQGVNKDKLDLILHTPGGDYEATKRLINYLHATYKHIRVFIPHMAMSGGTLLACAADVIFMGPYSSLGPTDTQIQVGDQYLPAQAIIKEFQLAFQSVSQNPKISILWSERLKQIPFGLLSSIENMEKNSLKYLQELLTKRNCKEKKPEEVLKVAEFLHRHEKHSSHGRGIFLKDLVGQLNVSDLSKNKELEDAVLSIYHSASILFEQRSHAQKIIINHKKRKQVISYNPPQR